MLAWTIDAIDLLNLFLNCFGSLPFFFVPDSSILLFPIFSDEHQSEEHILERKKNFRDGFDKMFDAFIFVVLALSGTMLRPISLACNRAFVMIGDLTLPVDCFYFCRRSSEISLRGVKRVDC